LGIRTLQIRSEYMHPDATKRHSGPDFEMRGRLSSVEPLNSLHYEGCMRLVDPSAAWSSAFLDMARECESAGEHRYALALSDFQAYLQRIGEGRRGEGLPAGWIPGAEFWLEDRGDIVGCARLRFSLTPDLENEGGHIGYDIRPSKRRQGYGTALLALVLVEARGRDIRRVRITCDFDNEGSIKVIERNGGKLAGTGTSPKSGKAVRQYWIERR
jgi:predicted acetyltransferase